MRDKANERTAPKGKKGKERADRGGVDANRCRAFAQLHAWTRCPPSPRLPRLDHRRGAGVAASTRMRAVAGCHLGAPGVVLRQRPVQVEERHAPSDTYLR